MARVEALQVEDGPPQAGGRPDGVGVPWVEELVVEGLEAAGPNPLL